MSIEQVVGKRARARAARYIGLAVVAACSAGLAACANQDDVNGGSAAGTTPVVDERTPADLAAVVERLMPSVERISGLDRIETLRVRRQTVAGSRAYVEASLEKDMTAAERDAVRRTYAALGLVPDTLDLDALLLDLYTEQVLGYYDPVEQTLFVVDGQDVDEIQVIAHELVHALQDQHTNLDSLIAPQRGNDRRMAAHAAMEGHAMVVMLTLRAEQTAGGSVSPASLPAPLFDANAAVQAQDAGFPVFRTAPRIVREAILFPYVSGANFVHAVWGARGSQRRYPAPIDSLLPQSTEQIMRPHDRFIRERDEPTVVSLGAYPAGWHVVREDDFGQFETAIFLAHHLGESAREAADGWDGDRYALLSASTGARVDGANVDAADVIVWVSVWETAAAADRFADAVRRVSARRPGRISTVTRETVDGRHAVRVIDAPAGVDTSALTGRQ